MIKTMSMLLDELNTYHDPVGKIKRLCQEHKLYQLTRGIYTTDVDVSGCVYAPIIYGPSYLSFDFALAYYGLIPEQVHVYTSATCFKGKKKYYHNDFGDYTYRDIPGQVFNLGMNLQFEASYIYCLATPEKALCDKLYTLPPLRNRTELENCLFADLRLEEAVVGELELQDILQLAPFYHCQNLKLLAKYVEKYLRRKS